MKKAQVGHSGWKVNSKPLLRPETNQEENAKPQTVYFESTINSIKRQNDQSMNSSWPTSNQGETMSNFIKHYKSMSTDHKREKRQRMRWVKYFHRINSWRARLKGRLWPITISKARVGMWAQWDHRSRRRALEQAEHREEQRQFLDLLWDRHRPRRPRGEGLPWQRVESGSQVCHLNPSTLLPVETQAQHQLLEVHEAHLAPAQVVQHQTKHAKLKNERTDTKTQTRKQLNDSPGFHPARGHRPCCDKLVALDIHNRPWFLHWPNLQTKSQPKEDPEKEVKLERASSTAGIHQPKGHDHHLVLMQWLEIQRMRHRQLIRAIWWNQQRDELWRMER